MIRTLWLGARATLFWMGSIFITIIYLFILPVLAFFPYRVCYPVMRKWIDINLWWLKVCCGVDYRVLGRENIPTNSAAIIMCNHQSVWETLAVAQVFPPLTWVLKKELLRIPIFGWGLKMTRPVAIDRSAGRTAVEQVKIQGKDRLDEGIWIVIFPEGTRVKPGQTLSYRPGGAILAAYSQYPVVPVAHNSGASWPRNSYIKKPGTITLSIGKPIKTRGRSVDEILAQVKDWIEVEKSELVFEER